MYRCSTVRPRGNCLNRSASGRVGWWFLHLLSLRPVAGDFQWLRLGLAVWQTRKGKGDGSEAAFSWACHYITARGKTRCAGSPLPAFPLDVILWKPARYGPPETLGFPAAAPGRIASIVAGSGGSWRDMESTRPKLKRSGLPLLSHTLLAARAVQSARPLLLSVGIALALWGCSGWPVTAIETELRSLVKADNVSVDRITYVNAAGDVYTINGDGSERHALTQGSRTDSGTEGPVMAQSLDFDNFHAWPTWSPGGERLAVSRVRNLGGRSAEVSVQLLDAATGRSQTVYSNEFPGLVADGSPHYLYWSPDDRHLSFLASTRQGLGLFVADTGNAGPPLLVERGAPLYYSWSGEGGALLVHVGSDLKLFRHSSGAFDEQFLSTAQGYRVPAFSPDGQWLAYIGPTDAGNALFVAGVDDLGQPSPLLDVNEFSAFMWSPTGAELAVGDQANGRALSFDRLRIVTAAGGEISPVTTDPSLAFYWSPDGRRLAWVGVNQEDHSFNWNVWNAASPLPGDAGESRALMTFQPSRDVLTMLGYFDQYAYSHSPWSPDSSRLVVAGTETLPYERRNGHTPTGSRVFVIDVSGAEPPLEIGEGTLAFWSWK